MSKFAIIETGAKQYRVESGTLLEVELLEAAEGQKEVTLDQVLLVKDGDKLSIGTPSVPGAKVVCEVLGEFRAPKVINFKYRRRKKSSRKVGHRQDLLRLRVKEVNG
ncbi:MAG: 50S ribosomal protein L21 [Candidatus Omnitrophota bacterium]|jgi:large subunit ribosomal protein L21